MKLWANFILLMTIFATTSLFAKKSGEPKAYTTGEIRKILRKVSTAETMCRRDQCDNLKMLQNFESILKSYLDSQYKFEGLKEESRSLKAQLKPARDVANFVSQKGCLKDEILKEIQINNGVPENGSKLFSKKPVGSTGGVCWTNGRKKKEATITLCNFPLAVNLQTKGGSASKPIRRFREYFFEPSNTCLLSAVRIADEGALGNTETQLTYDICKTNWNKRTADAGMSPNDAKLMEDIIGSCFRYHLLPLREEDGGRVNPDYKAPHMPGAK